MELKTFLKRGTVISLLMEDGSPENATVDFIVEEGVIIRYPEESRVFFLPWTAIRAISWEP